MEKNSTKIILDKMLFFQASITKYISMSWGHLLQLTVMTKLKLKLKQLIITKIKNKQQKTTKNKKKKYL